MVEWQRGASVGGRTQVTGQDEPWTKAREAWTPALQWEGPGCYLFGKSRWLSSAAVAGGLFPPFPRPLAC